MRLCRRRPRLALARAREPGSGRERARVGSGGAPTAPAARCLRGTGRGLRPRSGHGPGAAARARVAAVARSRRRARRERPHSRQRLFDLRDDGDLGERPTLQPYDPRRAVGHHAYTVPARLVRRSISGPSLGPRPDATLRPPPPRPHEGSDEASPPTLTHTRRAPRTPRTRAPERGLRFAAVTERARGAPRKDAFEASYDGQELFGGMVPLPPRCLVCPTPGLRVVKSSVASTR